MEESERRRKYFLGLDEDQEIDENSELANKYLEYQECVFKPLMENDKNFIKNHYQSFPEKITPCRFDYDEMIFGGKLDVFEHYWSAQEDPQNKVEFFDIISCYSDVARKSLMPSGKYKRTLFPNIFSKITIDYEKKCIMDNTLNRPAFGGILLSIIPPKNQFIPTLPYRLDSFCLSYCVSIIFRIHLQNIISIE